MKHVHSQTKSQFLPRPAISVGGFVAILNCDSEVNDDGKKCELEITKIGDPS
ncbi:MAG: hypothetical protein AMXMBFR82_19900 [Candidatus Hydrogenedentota bacterium]